MFSVVVACIFCLSSLTFLLFSSAFLSSSVVGARGPIRMICPIYYNLVLALVKLKFYVF